MAIDDKVQKVIEELERQTVVRSQDIALDTVINAIPVVGSSIAALCSGLAKQRVYERMVELFRMIKEELDKVEEGSINKAYFESAEFQTLFALTLEQLHTTHDKEKLQILANVLAHSGLEKFSNENRKELFVRSLRELTPAHIDLLEKFLSRRDPDDPTFKRRTAKSLAATQFSGTGLALIQHLLALGYINERSQPKDIDELFYVSEEEGLQPRIDWPEKLMKALKEPYERWFFIAELGLDFMQFIEKTHNKNGT